MVWRVGHATDQEINRNNTRHICNHLSGIYKYIYIYIYIYIYVPSTYLFMMAYDDMNTLY